MRASDITPQAWGHGKTMTLKRGMLIRKWGEVIKNAEHMEETLLLLMVNPATTASQLAQASALYVSVTKQLHESAKKIDESIYNEGKPKRESIHMLSCPAHADNTGNEEFCVCKDWQGEMR